MTEKIYIKFNEAKGAPSIVLEIEDQCVIDEIDQLAGIEDGAVYLNTDKKLRLLLEHCTENATIEFYHQDIHGKGAK